MNADMKETQHAAFSNQKHNMFAKYCGHTTFSKKCILPDYYEYLRNVAIELNRYSSQIIHKFQQLIRS